MCVRVNDSHCLQLALVSAVTTLNLLLYTNRACVCVPLCTNFIQILRILTETEIIVKLHRISSYFSHHDSMMMELFTVQ